MYFPSWATKYTRTAPLSGSGEPRPASSDRQPIIQAKSPATPATSAPASEGHDNSVIASRVSLQREAKP